MNQLNNLESTHYHQDPGDTSEAVGITEMPRVTHNQESLLTTLLRMIGVPALVQQVNIPEERQQ